MARRLRSSVSALGKLSDTEAEVALTAPPPKKRKTAVIPRFHCSSCSTMRMTKYFPDVNPSSECDHLINTCSTCLKKWVESRVESTSFEFGDGGKMFGVRCPECPGIMKEVNVENASTKKVLKRFQELARRHTADTTPGWRWCLNPKCKAGQVYEPKPPATTKPTKGGKKSKKQSPVSTDENICICQECGHRECVPCERPDHNPETCADYQSRIKGRVAEDDKSRAMLLKISKPCPSCSKPIQKAGGCNSMMCAGCHKSFCWECLELFTPRGCACTAKAEQLRAAARLAAGLQPEVQW